MGRVSEGESMPGIKSHCHPLTAQHDITSTNKLALDVDLRNSRPTAVLLDPLSQFWIVEAVECPGRGKRKRE